MRTNDKRLPQRVLLLAAVAAAGQSLALPVSAQSTLLEEVVVTAEKREQSLQDVGISVTALRGDQLVDLGFTQAMDMVTQTPGLEVSGAGGGTVNTYSIRGVTQNDFAASQEGPVALYIDDAYISLNTITNFSLLDIERIEVLRGPQGTLFGRNATGGLLHYVSRRPTQEAAGFVDLQLGEDGRQRIEAAASGGLTDTLAGRLAVVQSENDGLMENAIGSDLRQLDEWAVRGSLLFEPTADFSATLIGLYGDKDDNPGGYGHSVAFDGEFSDDPSATDFFGYRDADGDPFTTEQDFEGYKQAEATNLTLDMNWRLGAFDIVSITNYQDIESSYGEDADASPNDVYNYEQFEDVEQYSQELRLNFEGTSHRTVIGAYYLKIDGNYATVQSGDAFFGTGVGYPAGTTEDVDVEQTTETWALFGQTDIDLSDTLALTVGARLNRDDKDFDYRSTDIYFLQGGNYSFSDSFSDTDWSGKLQLNYRPSDDVLLYAGINRGIKSGGFNMPLYPIATEDYEFGGEALLAYELGFKSSLGASTRFNGAVFYYDYEDYQAYSFDGFATFLFNAEAEAFGGELELVTSPVEGLELLLGASYLDIEVTDVPLSISPNGKEDGVLAPEFTFNGVVRYTLPAFGGDLTLQLDGFWKDDHNFNLSFTPVIREEAYGVANARVIYETPDGRWWASLFVRNLTDEEYRTYAFDTTAFFGATEDIPGDYRWAGASVRFTW